MGWGVSVNGSCNTRGDGLWKAKERTSCFALVHRGISTIMLSTVCCSLAYSGMSWKGEQGTPSFST